MCNPASFIVTRNEVFFDLNGDSHEEIIRDNGLDDTQEVPDFVRTELVPPDENYSLPVDKWQYRCDQDRVPTWYSAADAEAECRRVLPLWAETHIVRDGKAACGEGQTRIFLGTSVARITGGVARLYDQSQSHGQVGGVARLWDQSQIHGQAGGVARLWDQSQIHGQAGGVARLYDQSQSHGQVGGVARLYDQSQSHGQVGGVARLYDQSQSHGQVGGVARLWDQSQIHGQVGGEVDDCRAMKEVIPCAR